MALEEGDAAAIGQQPRPALTGIAVVESLDLNGNLVALLSTPELQFTRMTADVP